MKALSEERWREISDILLSENDVDEENTKRTIIDPIILDLGWSLFGRGVHKEYKIRVGSKDEKVDYALVLEGSPKILLEAKKLRHELTDSDAKQVLSYGRIEGVRWCVLSNGKTWRFFNSEWGFSPDKALFRTFVLDPNYDPPEDLSLLSKSLVEEGGLDREAKRSLFDIRIKTLLSERLDELRKDVHSKARNILFKQLREEMPHVTRKRVLEAVESLLRVSLAEEETDVRPPGPTVTATSSGGPLSELPDGLVAVLPGKPSGVEWMNRFYAWGYVRIGRTPDYFALYVSSPVHGIQYLAEVDRVIDPAAPDSPVKDQYQDDSTHKPGKKVILFKKGSLRRLPSEIPLGKKTRGQIQSLRYCTLENLRKARTMDDLW
ncbi:MAG: type I restriction enzyme HsdR N-terminal domain-containing protein [Thermoplasmata archaeon]|nr:type I restriction enzyme HsdR N-terminal domain-containing protein [Thermoplasmata archaeon]